MTTSTEQVIKWLETYGSKPDRVDEFKSLVSDTSFDPNEAFEGRFAIAVASRFFGGAYARVMLELGVNPNCWDIRFKAAPLGLAAESGSIDSVRILLDHGADPNLTPPPSGRPPIVQIASKPSHVVILKRLLANGADPNLMSRAFDGTSSATALSTASSRGNTEGVRILIDAGADINVILPWGTALAQAVEEREFEIAKLLLENGADLSLASEVYDGIPMSGKTPMEIATQMKNARMIKLLSEYDTTASVPITAPAHESVSDVVTRIKKAVKGSSVKLQRGLTKEALASLEEESGLSLPDELRELYLNFNGEETNSEGLIPSFGGDFVFDENFQLLSLADAIAERSRMPDITHELVDAAILFPIAADGSGDVMCAVIRDGKVACVIQFNHETQKVDHVAESISNWLSLGLETWIEKRAAEEEDEDE